MVIKICGITNVEDALVAAEAGAQAVGFVFYPGSPRYVRPETAATIARALPGHIWKVGVFVNESREEIEAVVRAVSLDVVQVHGECGWPKGVRIWRAVAVGPGFDPEALDPTGVEAFLLDAPSSGAWGGTGTPCDWTAAARVRHRVVLAGGLGPDNVQEAIRVVQPWGVDASSRLELSPGKKDPDKVRAFVRAALATR